MSIHPSAFVIGQVDQALLDRVVTVAVGQRRDDKNWKNLTGTLDQLLTMLTRHETGDKDGKCLLQGKLVGAQRIAKNVEANHLVMVDIDTGDSVESIRDLLCDSGLFAVIWTTHSHLKEETTIKEEALLRFAKNRPDNNEVNRHCADYLLEDKLYAREIVDSITTVKKELRDGGMVFVVAHAPMPRMRVLFVLAEPFNFTNRGGSQKDAIDEWKSRYAGFSKKLGVPFDASCVDPSRLMYLPRRPKNGPAGDVIVIAGDTLTIDRMPRLDEVDDVGAPDVSEAFVAAGGGTNAGKTFKTPNLLRFMSIAGDKFAAASWLQHVDPDGERGTAGSGGIEHTCPRDEDHTPSADGAPDRAFWVRDAEDSGFVMHCRHNGCITASGDDRAWYLDQLCQKYGVKDALDLREFCPGDLEAEIEAERNAVTVAAKPGVLDESVAALTPDSSDDAVKAVLQALALITDELVFDRLLSNVVVNTDRSRATLKRIVKGFRDEAARRVQTDVPMPAIERGPPDIETYEGGIMPLWSEIAKIRTAESLLERKTGRDVTLFKRLEGGVVGLENTARGLRLAPIVSANDWGTVLTNSIPFYKFDEDTGELLESSADKGVVSYMVGTKTIKLPYIDRVVRVPVLGLDDKLLTEPGYDKSLQVYYDPTQEFLPVPDVIDDDVLGEAFDLLIESVRDFPFTDSFDGSDLLPIKLDELDAEGWPQPNLERGRSSRINFFGMLLQTFVRAHIHGPTPAYHFDKAAPGTGAGYLANVVSCIVTGANATPQTMAENEEEFRKTITATLRSGADIIFLDNVTRKVVSGHLAAALTSNTWRDRVLGVSEVCEIEVRSMWIIAGNNTALTGELLRRMVPIRLDANTPNPATDRQGAKEFKHRPNEKWVLEHRAELVWALHVLIMNWVRKGKPRGSVDFHSFDSWADVIGGIFEAAGVTGFLANRDAYLVNKNEEESSGSDVVQRLWDVYKLATMSSREMADVLDNDIQGNLLPSLGIDPADKGDKVMKVGKIIAAQFATKTFNVMDGTVEKKVKLVKSIKNHKAVYNFIVAE